MDFSGVSRRASRHIYVQVAQVIEDAIASGEIGPGDPVPPERYIAQSAGVSRAAVRHALALLRERRVIITIRDLGSFAAGSERENE